MTRAEYLAELDSHLITLPREERDMAIEFYNEYFEDAGPENEQAVIEELGKPYNLARSIIGETSAYNKSEVYIKYRESKPMPQNSTGVFVSLNKPGAFEKQNNDNAQNNFEDKIKSGLIGDKNENIQAEEKPQDEDIMPNGSPYRANFNIEHNAAPKYNETQRDNAGMFDQYYTHADTNNNTNYNYTPYTPKSSTSTGKILFWIFISIFVIIPIVIPVAIAIIAAAAAIAICAVVSIFAAFVVFIAGTVRIFSSLFEGIAMIATGIACAGVGMILLAITLLFFGKFLPWLTKRIFGVKRREA